MNIRSYLADLLALERNDIFFIYYPKSGGSWLRLLLLNCGLAEERMCYSHRQLNKEMPEIGCGIGLQSGIRFNSKRIIKSHRIIPGVTSRFSCFSTVRNPIHSLASLYVYGGFNTRITLKEYLNSKHGIPYLRQHYNFIKGNSQSVVVVSYEQLKKNTQRTISDLSKKLDLGISESRLEYVIQNFSRQEQIDVEKMEAEKMELKDFSKPKNHDSLIDEITKYKSKDLDDIFEDYHIYNQIVG
ncbi:MAG: sulfotransferase domain-containing protein [Cyclobacteriaceae bacterium]